MKTALIVATLCAALPLSSWSQSTPKPLQLPPEMAAELSQGEINKGMGRLKPKIDECGKKSQYQGVVTVGVKVSSSGTVDDVKVKSSPDPYLSVCVVAAVQKAAFTPTQKGGSFSHSFKF
jgi:TonB family protein